MTNEIQEIKNIVKSHLEKTDKVIASNEAIADLIFELDNTLSESKDTLVSSFSLLDTGLQELCFAVEEGFRELNYKLDLQNKTLQSIKKILERPLNAQAKELRKRAEFAYLNGWIDEAETDLLESEKKNYQDFIALHILGNIYYYHKKNPQKALEYYQKAAKYAAPQSKLNACKALLSAAKVYAEIGKVEDAYKSTRVAMEISPSTSEFSKISSQILFNHAAYAAMIGHTGESIKYLRQAVLNDPTFLITAETDERFSNVLQEKEKLKGDLRDNQRQIVEQLRKKLIVLRKNFDSVKEEAEEIGITDLSQFIKGLDSLDAGIDEIDKLYANNSYFDLLKAERVAHNIHSEGLKVYERNIAEWIRIKNSAISKLELKKADVKGGCLAWLAVLVISLIYFFLLVLLVATKKIGMRGYAWMPPGFLLVTILSFVLFNWMVKKIKRSRINREIEKENNTIARLSNLKDKSEK
jgi:tetratricopeptide (TPR) repeat protein